MVLSFLGSQKVESAPSPSFSIPRQPTSGGSANTLGTYQQSIAATAGPTAWVLVTLGRSSAATDYLVDIAVGAGGVEQVVIPSLPYSSNSTTSPPGASYLVPLFIPAGSRVACRCQAVSASANIQVQITCFAPMFGGELGLGQVEACGALTGTSLGTSVDPGTTPNTKGTTPTQLIAATSFPYKWVCVSINHTNALAAATSWAVDIMVGGSGSEVVVVPDLVVHGGNTADANPAIGVCSPLAIPAGTRISARCQSAITTASERLLEVVLHGVG